MNQRASHPTRADPGRVDLHLSPGLPLDDDLLWRVCQANPELRIERNPCTPRCANGATAACPSAG